MSFRFFSLSLTAGWILFHSVPVAADIPQTGPAFTVTNTADHNDEVCGVNDCTLREAISAANGAAGANTITFAHGVTGTITLQSGSGPFTITGPTTIAGPGSRRLALRGALLSRVLIFTSGAGINRVSGITIREGSVIGPAGGGLGAGGGILNQATLTLTDCALISNIAFGGDNNNPGGTGGEGQGGAIHNQGVLTLNNCTLSTNTAFGGLGGANPENQGGLVTTGGTGGAAKGGAIYNDTGRSLTITNCTFFNNNANGDTGGDGHFGGTGGAGIGGGIFNQGTMTLVAATFNANLAAGGAGGKGSAAINNGGAGPANGGGLANTGGGLGRGGTSTVGDSIVAGNTAKGGGRDVDGTFISNGFNLIGSADHSSGFTAKSDKAGTDVAPLDPMLGPLQDNGGGTDTMALLAGSPAINAANDPNAPPRDQRNYVRPDVADIGAFEFLGTIPVTLANISTRGLVLDGDNVLIAGFIILGTQPKRLALRAIGPSLPLPNALADPFLEFHDGNGQPVASNDNWRTNADADRQEIIAAGLAPTNDLESVLISTVSPGNFTAVVRGVLGTTGLAVVEGYDLDRTVNSKFANISTRGVVQTGDNVLIGGYIVLGPDNETVVVRGIGPSLLLSGKLSDPTLELRDGNGALLEANDNWIDSPNKQAIIDSTIPPSNDLESAIVRTLTPANYTAILRGAGGTTGIAVVEIYGLN